MRYLRLSISLLCCLLSLAPLARADAPPAPGPVVLKAAHIFDAVSGKLADHGVVVVQDGKITAVGANAQIPAGARVIDLGDATLMPGMIDAHVHMGDEFEDNWYKGFYQDLMRTPPEQALYGAHYAKETLDAGFTSVRDLGSTYYIAAALRNTMLWLKPASM